MLSNAEALSLASEVNTSVALGDARTKLDAEGVAGPDTVRRERPRDAALAKLYASQILGALPGQERDPAKEASALFDARKQLDASEQVAAVAHRYLQGMAEDDAGKDDAGKGAASHAPPARNLIPLV